MFYYLNDHLGSAIAQLRNDGFLGNFYLYNPYGTFKERHVAITDVGSDYQYTGQELDDEWGEDWYYYGARYYIPELRVFTSVDPQKNRGPSYSPYLYCHSNPINFIDPDGEWEYQVRTDSSGAKYTVLVAQEDDNFETLQQQTGLSEEELKGFYSEDELKNASEGDELTPTGGIFTAINEALNRPYGPQTKKSNCWGSALDIAALGKATVNGGVITSLWADLRLLVANKPTATPKTGTVVRYSDGQGYNGEPGNTVGGTDHFATFLLTNDQGTQVFTKNGWQAPWDIQYDHNFHIKDDPAGRYRGKSINSYGTPTGIGPKVGPSLPYYNPK